MNKKNLEIRINKNQQTMNTPLESMMRALENVDKEYKQEQREVALGKENKAELNLLFEALRQGRECVTTLITLQAMRKL